MYRIPKTNILLGKGLLIFIDYTGIYIKVISYMSMQVVRNINAQGSFNSLRPSAAYICVNQLTIIFSDNGLSPDRHQAIIWNNDGILSFGPLGRNFSKIVIEMYIFSFKKMHLKISSGKWRPCCLGLNVLKIVMLPCQEADVFRNGNLWCVKTYWKSYDKIHVVGGIRCDTGKVTLLMCLIHLSFFLYRWVWAYLSQNIYLYRVMLWIYIFMPINYLLSPPYYSALRASSIHAVMHCWTVTASSYLGCRGLLIASR